MIRGPRTDVLVARLMEVALAVTDLRLGDAGDSLVGQFDAPEASGTELGELLAGSGKVFVWGLGDGGIVDGRVGFGAEAEAEVLEDVHGRVVERDGSTMAGEGEREGCGKWKLNEG